MPSYARLKKNPSFILPLKDSDCGRRFIVPRVDSRVSVHVSPDQTNTGPDVIHDYTTLFYNRILRVKIFDGNVRFRCCVPREHFGDTIFAVKAKRLFTNY